MRAAGLTLLAAAAAAAAAASGGACARLRAPAAEPELEFRPAPESAAAPETAESGAAPADWWTSFGERELDRLVDRALARNLGMEGAAARLAQAAAEAGAARSALFPRAEAGASRLAEQRNFIGLPIPGIAEGEVLSADYVAYGLSLDLSWEASLWNAATPRARAARAGFEAAVMEVAGARVSLAGQAARLYFLAVESRERARLAEAAARNREEAARWRRERARIGEASLASVDAAEARAAEAQAEAASRREAFGAAVRAIEVLITDYPDGVPGPGWTLDAGLPGEIAPPPAGVPADLIARRPDVARAERRLAASREFTAIARRARYPQFRLTGSVGTATTGLRSLVDGDFSVWSLLAGIAAPIFDGGRIRAEIRREEAADRAALADYADAALTAYQEVEAGLAAERALAEIEGRAAAALAESRRALRRAEALRRSGLASRGEALDAERAALSAETAHLSRVRARLDNRVNLFLALGGGFDRAAAPDEAAADGSAGRGGRR